MRCFIYWFQYQNTSFDYDLFCYVVYFFFCLSFFLSFLFVVFTWRICICCSGTSISAIFSIRLSLYICMNIVFYIRFVCVLEMLFLFVVCNENAMLFQRIERTVKMRTRHIHSKRQACVCAIETIHWIYSIPTE